MKTQNHDLGVSTDLEALDRFINVNGLFLVDAGCGNIHLSRALAERGARVLAIDPDPVQAKVNQTAEIIANVGFAQIGADAVPVESQSVDGVLFSYSLHHVLADQYAAVFNEVTRIVKPAGLVYVVEPVASGELNEVMRLFHDEQAVRETAQSFLDQFAFKYFNTVDVINYRVPIQYRSWEEFASKYAAKSYNTNYTESQVRAGPVKERFIELGEARGYAFESPVKVTYLRNVYPQTAGG